MGVLSLTNSFNLGVNVYKNECLLMCLNPLYVLKKGDFHGLYKEHVISLACKEGFWFIGNSNDVNSLEVEEKCVLICGGICCSQPNPWPFKMHFGMNFFWQQGRYGLLFEIDKVESEFKFMLYTSNSHSNKRDAFFFPLEWSRCSFYIKWCLVCG